MMSRKEKIILGIDPGTVVTGYAILRLEESLCIALDYGCVRPPLKAKLSDRYLIISNALDRIIAQHEPHELAIESQFVGKNPQSALKLAQARVLAIVAAKKRGMLVYEYTPKEVKKAIGNGKASKTHVKELVSMLLGLSQIPNSDAADALAVAFSHANRSRFSPAFDKEI